MSARTLHQKLLATLSKLARVERQAVLLFAEIAEKKLHRHLGYSTMLAYAREELGFSDARYYQFQRLAEAFKELPKVKDAVASGELPWTKAREVAKVATAESQGEWIDEAKKSTSRELESKVRVAKASGKRAPGPELFFKESSGPAARQEVSVTLKLDPEQLAQLEALMEALRKQGLKGSREEVLLAALDLAVQSDCTRVQSRPKQIVMYRCEECGRTKVSTSRGLIEVESRDEDAQVLGSDGVNRSAIPPKTRRQVLARDGHRCKGRGCGSRHFLEVHRIVPRSRGGSNREENLVTLCSACHRLAHGG